ncbi:probable membrane-associated kinase regulator 1 [Rosa chinensis]|uniref:probable membrane-associated kinase regulator 1 n=1 Tax=Rosa chinensis TaxID=74649 RepID=UPI000D08EE34|nr:probable membrane-associated kinase regulator 1 [Rosa chinensis]
MGRNKKLDQKSHTLPPSPTHSFSSSSSSDFEFTISCSPRKSSTPLCRPADELFYKGQLLPLHLSPRLSMVRTLLLLPSSSSSSSSAASDTTSSRDSTVSSSNDSRDSCDSSARPSSVAEEDEFKRLNSKYSSNDVVVKQDVLQIHNLSSQSQIKKNSKYFSLSRFSSVFKKDPNKQQHRVVVDADHNDVVSGSNSVKRASNTAKEVIRKYMKKVKPLYEKLSQKQQKMTTASSAEIRSEKVTSSTDHELSGKASARNRESTNGGFSHSFSGNLRYPRRRGCVSSCPSSMRCSPSHSGVLSRTGQPAGGSSAGRAGATTSYAAVDRSSMEELQSAIQGAIAHCKNSLVQNKTMFSNEI